MSEDKYSKLIELVDRNSEYMESSMTHIKRGARISTEIASHLLEMAKIFAKNYQYLPPNELNDMQEVVQEVKKLNDEFSEFFGDYAKDLENIGTSLVEVYEEFLKCV